MYTCVRGCKIAHVLVPCIPRSKNIKGSKERCLYQTMSTVCEFSGQKNAVLYHTVSTICEFSGQKNAVFIPYCFNNMRIFRSKERCLYQTVSTICEFSGQKNAVDTKLCQQYANFQVKRTLFIPNCVNNMRIFRSEERWFIPNCVNNMRIFRSKERCLYQTVSTICEIFRVIPFPQATKQHLNNSDTVKKR